MKERSAAKNAAKNARRAGDYAKSEQIKKESDRESRRISQDRSHKSSEQRKREASDFSRRITSTLVSRNAPTRSALNFTHPTVQIGNRNIVRTTTPDISHITNVPQKPVGILDRVKEMVSGEISSLKGTMQAEQAKPLRQRIMEGVGRSIVGPVGTVTGKLMPDAPVSRFQQAMGQVGLQKSLSPLKQDFGLKSSLFRATGTTPINLSEEQKRAQKELSQQVVEKKLSFSDMINRSKEILTPEQQRISEENQSARMGFITGITNAPEVITSKIPINKIVTNTNDFTRAIGDVNEGKSAVSRLPILVGKNKDGSYFVKDGNTRLAEMMTKGETHVDVITDEKAYRKLSQIEEQSVANRSPRYIKNEQGKFAGSRPRQTGFPFRIGLGIEDVSNGGVRKAETVSGVKPRGFAKTVEKSNLAPKEISEQLVEDTYKVKPNEETASRVRAILELGEDNALKVARDANHPESNAMALKLMEDALKKNEFQKFSMLNKEFSPRFTKQGQQIQVISKFGKLTPTGAVRYAEHIIEEANRLSGSKLKLTDEVMAKIKGLAEDVAKAPEGREKVVAIAKMMDKIAEQVPEGMGKKIATLQTMAQLLNPKTAIRNVLGNVALGTTETVSDVVGTGIDKLLSVFPKWNRSMGLPSIVKQLSGVKKGFKLGMEDALLGIDTSGFGTKFDLPTRTFRKGLLDKMEKAMNIELRATDRAFYQGAFDDSINSMMKAMKVEKATPEMLAQAGEEALYRTFQNDSALANAMVKLKKGLNFGKDFGIGDLINKYPKTPANIVNVGMDYSPLGVFKVAKQVYDITKGITSVSQLATRRNLIKQISRVLVGTGIIGTGYVLAKNKIVSGKVEKDKDVSSLQKITGGGPFKLNISALRRMINGEDANPKNGDLQISYDWLQPNAIPFSIGVNMALGDKKAEDALNVAIEGLESGVDTLTQQPVIQGVKRFAQDFSSKGLVRAVGNQLAGAPASFVPTLVNQMRQKFGNNITRETYDPNVFKEGLNRAMAKIPGLENKLPERINQMGEPLETYQGGSNSVINVFFNPAFVSRINESPEAKMVLDLYRTTGERGQVPRIAPEFIKDENGNRVDMTPEQYTSFQKFIGTKTQEAFSQLAQSKEFQSMSDVDKVNKLTSLLTSISADAKKEILGIGKGSGTSDEAFMKYTQELKSLNDRDFKKRIKELKGGTPEEQTMADTMMRYRRDDIAKEIGLDFKKKWSELEQVDKTNVLEEHIKWLGDKEKVEFFKTMLDKDFLTDPQIKEIAKRGVLKPDDILRADVGSGVKAMVLYETLKEETGDFFKDAEDRQGALDELNAKTEERLKDAITKLDMSPREKQAQFDSIVQGLKDYRVDDRAKLENLAKEDERWSQMTVNDRAGVLVKYFTGMDKSQSEEKFSELEDKGLISDSVKEEFKYQWKKAKIQKIEELPSLEEMRNKPLSEMTDEELKIYQNKLASATQSAQETLNSSDDPTAMLASVNIGQGTLAARNNNPGNLRYAGQPGATQGEGGFARFETPEAGYEALKAQIELDKSRGMTVQEFVSKYAPPSENDTATYIKQFNASVGSGSNTKLSSLDTDKVAEFMALKESSTRLGEKIAQNPPTLNQSQTTLLRQVATGKITEERATQKVLEEVSKVATPEQQQAAEQIAVIPPKVPYNNIGYIPPEYFNATSRIYGLIASLQLLQSRWSGTAPSQII